MKSHDIFIRQLKPEDYDSIVSFWSDVNLPFRPKGRDSYEKVIEQIRSGNTLFLVAEINGRIVGTILGTHDGRKGWINRLAVDSEFRRKSIATRLVSEVENWFEESGLEIFACIIERNNVISVELFDKLGYGEWDGRYFSKRKSSES
jgi:ribosomal protein S18 acetylase RimI-like enzyme